MGAKPCVGVEIGKFIHIGEVPMDIVRFHPNTGEKTVHPITQKALFLKNGSLIPFVRKKLFFDQPHSFADIEEGYDVKPELEAWVEANGFNYTLFSFFHSRTEWGPPSGVLGIPLWGYRPGNSGSYDCAGGHRGTRHIDLEMVNERIGQVLPLLQAIHCDLEPKLFVQGC